MLPHRVVSSFIIARPGDTRQRACSIGLVGPDLIVVDGIELGAFYRDAPDAHAGINRHIDALEKAAREKAVAGSTA